MVYQSDGRATMKMNRRRMRIVGLHNRNIWAMDFDYCEKLSDKELEYLLQFSSWYYNANNKKMVGKYPVTEKRHKEAVRRVYTQQNDCLNQGITGEIKAWWADPTALTENDLIDMIDNMYVNR